MKKLCLLANEFPYGVWEPYLETESRYYEGFKKIIICSMQLRDEHAKEKRELSCDPIVIPVRYVSRLQYFLESITTLSDINLYTEAVKLIRQKRMNIHTLISLFVFFSRAHHEARVIDAALKNARKDDMILYSYRFEYQPYVAILLKKKWKSKTKIVCRAHRYDLYEDQHKEKYIPMRETILENIDRVYPCSENGSEYLKKLFPKYAAKVETRYLGTIDYGIGPMPKRQDTIRLVSCSNVVPVKRLEKIIEALSLISDMRIIWTHYGDGPLLDSIKKKAATQLPSNIKTEFKGNVANITLMEEYKNVAYDIFVNVSSSEGLPVSIMEALSFGILCIATDVGGTKEIIHDCNYGTLLKNDFKAIELRDAIKKYCNMSDKDFFDARKSAREWWNNKFDAEKNYRSFIKEIKES